MQSIVRILFSMTFVLILQAGVNEGPSQSTQKELDAWSAIEKASTSEEQANLAEEFLEKFPESELLPQVHDILARAYLDQGVVERFVQHAERSLKNAPDNPYLLVTLAVEYAERAELEKAVEGAELGLRLIDRLTTRKRMSAADLRSTQHLVADAHYALGLVYLRKYVQMINTGTTQVKILNQAQNHLQKAVSLDPEHDRSHYRLGFVFVLRNKQESAVRSYARAVALNGITAERARMRLESAVDLLRRNSPDSTLSSRGLWEIVAEQEEAMTAQIDQREAELEMDSSLSSDSGKRSELPWIIAFAGSQRGSASEIALRILREETNVTRASKVKLDGGIQQLLWEQLDMLKTRFDLAKVARRDFLNSASNSRAVEESRKRWKCELKLVGESADDLSSFLERAFSQMTLNIRSQIKLTQDAVYAGFAGEMDFIQEELSRVEQQILDAVDSTRTGAMLDICASILTRLDRVEKMAKKIRLGLRE